MLALPRSASAKRLALGVLCAVVAAALASGLALQGKHYFYCAAMGVVVVDPCAEATPADRDVAVHETRFDCCRSGRMPNLPQGAVAAPPDVPAASLVAVLPVPPAIVPPPAREARIAERATGPPPLPDARVHARLMIFLT